MGGQLTRSVPPVPQQHAQSVERRVELRAQSNASARATRMAKAHCAWGPRIHSRSPKQPGLPTRIRKRSSELALLVVPVRPGQSATTSTPFFGDKFCAGFGDPVTRRQMLYEFTGTPSLRLVCRSSPCTPLDFLPALSLGQIGAATIGETSTAGKPKCRARPAVHSRPAAQALGWPCQPTFYLRQSPSPCQRISLN